MKTKRQINILTWGGLGDVLLSTPSLKALKENSDDCSINVFYRTKSHRDLLINNPYIDKLRPINKLFYLRSFFKSLSKKPDTYSTYNYSSLFPSVYYKIKASDIIAEMLGTQLKENQLHFYLTSEEDKWAMETLSGYKTPIIIHITSITSSNQHWPLAYWEELVSALPEYTFIQVGGKDETKVKNAIDFTGKTTVRESLALLKHAKSFIGVVSFFSHATNAVNTPGVVLFGPSCPVIWGHENNINLSKQLHCAPCVDQLFRYECPYGVRCMKKISVNEVIESLHLQLNKRKEQINIYK